MEKKSPKAKILKSKVGGVNIKGKIKKNVRMFDDSADSPDSSVALN
jgi:hypothetical protein